MLLKKIFILTVCLIFHFFPCGIVSSGVPGMRHPNNSDMIVIVSSVTQLKLDCSNRFFPQQFVSENAELLSDPSTSYKRLLRLLIPVINFFFLRILVCASQHNRHFETSFDKCYFSTNFSLHKPIHVIIFTYSIFKCHLKWLFVVCLKCLFIDGGFFSSCPRYVVCTL